MLALFRSRFSLVALALLLLSGSRLAADLYTVVELPPLDGGTFTTAAAMNSSGNIVGTSDDGDGNTHAVLWRVNTTTGNVTDTLDLGVLAGGNNSAALAVNATGVVVGNSEVLVMGNITTHAVKWAVDGADMIIATDLGTLDPMNDAASSYARNINSSGIIVGSSTNPNGYEHAFIYNGTMTDLNGLDVNSDGAATGINASGQLAGWGQTILGPRAYRLIGNTTTELPTLSLDTFTHTINANGTMVGESDLTLHHTHGVYWTFSGNTGTIHDIGLLDPTDEQSAALDLNDAGVIVGNDDDVDGFEVGVIFKNGNLTDLNTLIGDSLWTLGTANAIDSHGLIVGDGTNPDGDGRAFLLVTVPIVSPSVKTQPVSTTVVKGKNAIFTVSATGDAPLSYQWFKDNQPIASGGTSATLTLTKVATTAAGKYKVVVSNPGGNVTSSTVTLTVLASATLPKITTQPKAVSTKKNGTATFTVKATGTAPLKYQWQKNSVNLVNGGQISGATTAALKISKVTTANNAKYRVIISNPAGTVTSAAVALKVT